jgi:hypothetical protein
LYLFALLDFLPRTPDFSADLSFFGAREMSAGKQAFKKTEATRLLKAVVDAGVDIGRLRLVHDLLGHTIRVEVRDESGGSTRNEGNELDHWMASRADESERT